MIISFFYCFNLSIISKTTINKSNKTKHLIGVVNKVERQIQRINDKIKETQRENTNKHFTNVKAKIEKMNEIKRRCAEMKRTLREETEINTHIGGFIGQLQSFGFKCRKTDNIPKETKRQQIGRAHV